MDYDLWGPTDDPVVQDDTSYWQTGWGSDFLFDYRLDVIEEDARNERSCLQVLRILIKKADTEIDELERDLVLLQNELAWVECEDWSDICYNALREKIDGLESSLKALRKGKVEDSEIQLLMHRGPAETLHEILRALLKNYCQAKDKPDETRDVFPPSHFDSGQCETEHLDKNVKAYAENNEIRGHQDTGLKLQEKITNDSESEQPAKHSKVSNTDASKDPSDSNNERDYADSESIIKRKEAGDYCSLSIANNNTVSDPTKQADLMDPSKHRKTLAKDSATNVNKHALGHLNEIKKLGNIYLNHSGLGKFREFHSPASDISKSPAALGQEKCGSPDMKDLVSRAKERLKDKKSPTENMDALDSFLKEEKRENPLQIMSFQDFLTATERSATNSLLCMCDEHEKDTDELKENGLERAEPEGVHIARSIAANDEMSMNLFVHPQNQKPECSIESNPESIKKPGSVSMEKKQQKSSNNDAGSNKPLNGVIKRKIVQHRQSEDGELTSDVDDSVKHTKKRKSLIQPMVKEINSSTAPTQSSDTHMDSLNKEGENALRAIASDPMAIASDLKDLKLNDLRAIAKAHRLTHYYKLKKNDLVEQLMNQLSPS